MNHNFEDPEGLTPALKAGRCQHWEQRVSSPGECVRIRGGGTEDTGQTDRPYSELIHAVGGRIGGQTDGVSARVAAGGSQPRPGLGKTWPTGGYTHTHRDTRANTTEWNSANSTKRGGVKRAPRHTHSRNDSQAEIQPGSSGKREGERATEGGEARISERRGRSGERGSDRHTDRRDSDTAHGKGINTDPHMRARPGSSTWNMLGVWGQWMNSWEGKWVWSHRANEN